MFHGGGEGAGPTATASTHFQQQQHQHQHQQQQQQQSYDPHAAQPGQEPSAARVLSYETYEPYEEEVAGAYGQQYPQQQQQQQQEFMPHSAYDGFSAPTSSFASQPSAAVPEVPPAGADAAGYIWVSNIDAEIEQRRQKLALIASQRDQATQLLERARVQLSPQVSPAIRELLSRIGAPPAAAATAAAGTTASATAQTTPGRGHGQLGAVPPPPPPPPSSNAERGTLNIMNAALRDVKAMMQAETSRLQNELEQMAALLATERLDGEGLREELGRLAASEAGLRAKVEEVTRACEELQAALDARDRSNRELEETVRALEAELAVARDSLEGARAAMEERVAVLQAALDESHRRLGELRQAQEAADFFKGEVERQHAELTAAVAERGRCEVELQQAHEELGQLRAQLESQRQPAAAAGTSEEEEQEQEQAAWYQGELARKDEELAALRSQLESQQQQQQQQPTPEHEQTGQASEPAREGTAVDEEQAAWYQAALAQKDVELQALQDSWTAYEEAAARARQEERDAEAAAMELLQAEAEGLRQQLALMAQVEEAAQQGAGEATTPGIGDEQGEQHEQQLVGRVAELEAALGELEAAKAAALQEVKRLTEMNEGLRKRIARECPAPPPPPGPPPARSHAARPAATAEAAAPTAAAAVARVSECRATLQALVASLGQEESVPRALVEAKLLGLVDAFGACDAVVLEVEERGEYWRVEAKRLREEGDRLYAALLEERAERQGVLDEQAARHAEELARYQEQYTRLQGEVEAAGESVRRLQTANVKPMLRKLDTLQKRFAAKAPQRAFARWRMAVHRAALTELAETKAALAARASGMGPEGASEDMQQLERENSVLRRELAQAEAERAATATEAMAQQVAGGGGSGLARSLFVGVLALGAMAIQQAIAPGSGLGAHNFACMVDTVRYAL